MSEMSGFSSQERGARNLISFFRVLGRPCGRRPFWTPNRGFERICFLYLFEEFWSGCRHSNSGPLAPQARNINLLQANPNENKRLAVVRFGRQMDARWTPDAESPRIRTPSGLQCQANCPSSHLEEPRTLSKANRNEDFETNAPEFCRLAVQLNSTDLPYQTLTEGLYAA